MRSRDSIAAVVVTFFPDDTLYRRLDEIALQVGLVVMVDNGSSPEITFCLKEWAARTSAVLICNAVNLGLATALNQGVRRASAQSFEWVITFDQDSMPEDGMVNALWESSHAGPDPEQIVVIGAHTYDERNPSRRERWLRPKWYGFERIQCGAEDLENVTFVITSGALTRVAVWEKLGGFDERLFIDYIDHDFCLRALRAGFKITVSARARLAHNLGAKRQVRAMGHTFQPTFHSARRHYYMARNRVLMWRRHAVRFPHWWLFDFCFGLLNTLRVLVVEDQRKAKMSAMLRGTIDGLLNRWSRDGTEVIKCS